MLGDNTNNRDKGLDGKIYDLYFEENACEKDEKVNELYNEMECFYFHLLSLLLL